MSKKANRFYVYIHTRNDTDEVFYVGKGSGKRAWKKRSYNKWWTRVSEKHGYRVKIIQRNMSEDDAFLLEMWLIAKFRHEGVDLCNMTDGGEGSSGVIASNRKSVCCSNGMEFGSMAEAASWLKEMGLILSHPSAISACCLGKIDSAYGFSWWFKGDPPKEYISKGDRISTSQSRAVVRSDGKSFSSVSDAVKYLADIDGVYINSGAIYKVIGLKGRSSGGYSWWYKGSEPVEFIGHAKSISIANGHKIQNCDGNTFNSMNEAARWVESSRGVRAFAATIRECCIGGREEAYGYKWSYVPT